MRLLDTIANNLQIPTKFLEETIDQQNYIFDKISSYKYADLELTNLKLKDLRNSIDKLINISKQQSADIKILYHARIMINQHIISNKKQINKLKSFRNCK